MLPPSTACGQYMATCSASGVIRDLKDTDLSLIEEVSYLKFNFILLCAPHSAYPNAELNKLHVDLANCDIDTSAYILILTSS
jgi:hypothetical protein